jgi:hypothetical protein
MQLENEVKIPNSLCMFENSSKFENFPGLSTYSVSYTTENDNLTGLQTITSRKLSACIFQLEQQNRDCGRNIIEAADLHPKDSAIFWTGLGICLNRVHITKKGGLDGNMTNCLKNNKRQNWVDYLLQQSHLTSTNQYNEKQMKKIERKMPKKLNN